MQVDYFVNAGVAGVPLVFVVLGLVQWLKKLGVDDKGLIGASMAIGLLLGGGYQIATVGIPVDIAGWFSTVVYGLGLGVVASGVYDAAERIVSNAVHGSG